MNERHIYTTKNRKEKVDISGMVYRSTVGEGKSAVFLTASPEAYQTAEQRVGVEAMEGLDKQKQMNLIDTELLSMQAEGWKPDSVVRE